MAEFRMPSLGADMTDGVLLEWLVEPGATVHRGDIVAVVDTDKAAIDVECFDSGTVRQLLVEPGTRVPVGTPLAVIAAAREPAGPARPASRATATNAAPTRQAAPPQVLSPLVRREAQIRHVDLRSVHGTGPGGRVTRHDVELAAGSEPAAPPAPPAGKERVRVSPRARRLAQNAGIDLSTVPGSGPGGVVRAADVRRTAERRAATTVPAEAQPATEADRGTLSAAAEAARRAAAMRGTIAALMSRSKREIPHYYLTETIDLSDTLDWLHDRNQALPVPRRIVPAALLLKAAARAAREVPELNGFWIDDHFQPAPAVHLGVAISLRGGGLVAPAIADADTLPLDAVMSCLKDLVARTRAGRLRGSELSSPTLTVTNLGEQGVESIIGVIYPPQVALVGFGTITERPWAVHGLLGVRRLVTASLAADHRATDGATGSRYLRILTRLLHRPEEL